jgi:hypothetical protein
MIFSEELFILAEEKEAEEEYEYHLKLPFDLNFLEYNYVKINKKMRGLCLYQRNFLKYYQKIKK